MQERGLKAERVEKRDAEEADTKQTSAELLEQSRAGEVG